MVKEVLLAMDQGTADKFGPYLQNNGENLRVLTQSVAVFHNIKPSLQKYHPDIVYISLSRLKYDHIKPADIEQEVCDGIYEIKSDGSLKNIRIAIQASQKNRPSFLRKLAMLRVSDIFVARGKAGSMDQVAPQLSRDENLKNISQYLNGDLPAVPVSSNDNAVLQSTSDEINTGRIKQLERLLKLANTQVNYYKSQDKIQSVPRKDYDELLEKVRSLMSSGITDEKVKKIFAQVLNSKAADSEKIKKLSTLVKAQNEQLENLNSAVEEAEKMKEQNQLKKPEPPRLSSRAGKYYQDSYRDEDYSNYDEDDSSYERQAKSERPKVHRATNTKSRPKNSTSSSNTSYPFKKIFKVFLIVLLVFTGIFGGMKFIGGMRDSTQNSEQSSTPSFNSLLKKGEYVKAAKYYNSRGVEAENKMISDAKVKNKADIAAGIAQYNSSDAIKFDTNYFNEDYSNAASIYNASTDTNLTKLIKARKIMVSYALMKDSQIAKAKSIAEPLNNAQLNKRIEIYGKFYHANQVLEAKIKHGHLSSSEINNAKKQISENEAEMDKL